MWRVDKGKGKDKEQKGDENDQDDDRVLTLNDVDRVVEVELGHWGMQSQTRNSDGGRKRISRRSDPQEKRPASLSSRSTHLACEEVTHDLGSGAAKERVASADMACDKIGNMRRVPVPLSPLSGLVPDGKEGKIIAAFRQPSGSGPA